MHQDTSPLKRLLPLFNFTLRSQRNIFMYKYVHVYLRKNLSKGLIDTFQYLKSVQLLVHSSVADTHTKFQMYKIIETDAVRAHV